MKKLIFSLFTIFLHAPQLFAQEISPIISKMVVSEDKEVNGVQGILVSFVYRFPDFKKDTANWGYIDKSEFKMATRIYVGNESIQAQQGWVKLSDNKNRFLFTSVFNSVLISYNRKNQILEQFIPYASLKLPEGKNTVSIESTFEGIDYERNKYKQVLKKEEIQFRNPASRTFTLALDSLEANVLNRKGQGWDYSMFGSSAPDIEVRVMMGTTAVWSEIVSNSYVFFPSKASKSVKFNIAEGDEVLIKVVDIDPIGSENIASFRLLTYDKTLGSTYYISEPKENLKSCHFSFVVTR